MEQQIKIASKLYECRDTARKFFKEEFEEKIKPHQHIIKQVCEQNKLEVLPALLKICQLESVQENGFSVMMFMAAAVELIEPSIKPESHDQKNT